MDRYVTDKNVLIGIKMGRVLIVVYPWQHL